MNTVLDAHPTQRVAWLPHRADVVTYLKSELRPGDLCLTMGAGDLTTLPDVLLELLAARGLMAESIEVAAAILGDLATRDAPFGELTTYRVGGPRRAPRRRARRSRSRGRRVGRAESRGSPSWRSGAGRTRSSRTRGFDGLVVMLGDAFATIEIDGTSVRAGGAASLPVVARTTAAAGLRGFEWAVGVPGSIGGAVRMNAGGHGSDMAAVLRRVRVVDLGSGKDVVVSAAELDLGYRHSALDHRRHRGLGGARAAPR